MLDFVTCREWKLHYLNFNRNESSVIITLQDEITVQNYLIHAYIIVYEGNPFSPENCSKVVLLFLQYIHFRHTDKYFHKLKFNNT